MELGLNREYIHDGMWLFLPADIIWLFLRKQIPDLNLAFERRTPLQVGIKFGQPFGHEGARFEPDLVRGSICVAILVGFLFIPPRILLLVFVRVSPFVSFVGF